MIIISHSLVIIYAIAGIGYIWLVLITPNGPALTSYCYRHVYDISFNTAHVIIAIMHYRSTDHTLEIVWWIGIPSSIAIAGRDTYIALCLFYIKYIIHDELYTTVLNHCARHDHWAAHTVHYEGTSIKVFSLVDMLSLLEQLASSI